MLRVGYPGELAAELLPLFPDGIELVAIPSHPDAEIDIDVWIPPPAAVPGQRVWLWLRGVTVALSMMAGTDWLTKLVGPEVIVCNAQGAHNIATAEWTVASILAMMKHFPFYGQLQRDANWRGRSEVSKTYSELHDDRRPQFPPVLQEELHGKRVLMLGYGDIGKTIETYLAPFEVQMSRIARSARKDPEVHAVGELDNLLPSAEIVIVILPLTSESQGMIGQKQLASMAQGALLVNAARGPIVQTDSLVAALESGHIRAALDVTDPEPLPAEHPLWKCPNLLITPHVAGSSPEFSRRAIKIAADQVRRLLAGAPLAHVVQAGSRR